MDEKREVWIVGKTMANAIHVLNSLFCDGEKDKAVSQDDKAMVSEFINANCSSMMKDDVFDILTMVNNLPEGRYCHRTDCRYHHPENPERHDYTIFLDKCAECDQNTKAKAADMHHFEDKD